MELLIRYLGNSLAEVKLQAMDPDSYGELVNDLFLVAGRAMCCSFALSTWPYCTGCCQ